MKFSGERQQTPSGGGVSASNSHGRFTLQATRYSDACLAAFIIDVHFRVIVSTILLASATETDETDCRSLALRGIKKKAAFLIGDGRDG